MKAIVTIDTEADNQWESYDTVITRNVDCIPRFQELCDRYGIRPTYLCTYEIVRSQQFDRILRGYQDREAAEIGAHLHTWTTPPFENDPDLRQGCPYTCELPAEAIRRKMEVLTEAIASKTGRRPSSYRAGRWGFSAEQIPVLLHLGYRVECSVTPLVSWAGVVGFETGGPDFTRASARPYFLDFDDVCRSGDSALLEVPVTILHTNRAMRNGWVRALYDRYKATLPWRALNRMFGLAPQWFRPFPHMSVERLEGVCKAARRQGLPAVEMAFHSSELMPGGSPNFPTEESVEHLYATLEGIFRYLSRAGCEGVTLSEFRDQFTGDEVSD